MSAGTALASIAAALLAVAPACTAKGTPLELARQLTNPFADLISVPINQNPDFDIGGSDNWRYTLTVQPVIPIHLSADWNIISRTVVPLMRQEIDGIDASGLGDVLQSFFLSPTRAEDSGLVWGVGPIFLLPTATSERLGEDLWGAGPTLGLLNRRGPWTLGLLANQIWSFAGRDGSKRNTTFLQPFIDYTTESRTTFSINTESTYDRENGQWTVPVNAVVRQLFTIDGQQVSVALGARYYFEKPVGGPTWGLRLGVTLLFPK